MNKVYVIRYEEFYSNGEYASGISYVFDNLDKAKSMLEEIKIDEMNYYEDNGWEMEDIKRITQDLITENGFIIDFSLDEYTKYIIEEMEVK